jgi:tetratricopeptide (TPR) repeat protein
VRCSARGRRRTLATVAAACLIALCGARTAAALSAGEIRAQARQVGGASGDAAAEQRRVEQLGPLVLAFIDLCDDAARAGTEAARREELRGTFDAIYGPLNSIYASRSGKLESMSRAIMDQDGDLEALYESRDFRDSQAVAAAALYHLNWLDYYGGRLHDGARKKELLEAAEKGFSEFASGDQKNELITESQLGRGLCYLELGDYDSAVRDFKLVVDDAQVSPERRAKARLAILDAYSRSGRLQDTLRYSDELLRGGALPASDLALVRFYRLSALFDAIDKSKGGDAGRYRQEASALMEQLRRSGKGWADKVDAMMVAHIDDPAQWAGKAQSPRVKWELARLMLAKSDYDGAAPLLVEVIGSSDAEAKPLQPEAHYWLAVARFKGNDFPAAADEFDAALATPGDWAKEARYLRFKALEALMVKEANPALAERYAAALSEFVAQGVDHPLIAEGRYRLAEYRQASGQFDAAIEAYGKVKGDPGYELRARFGTLQSRFELMKSDADAPARKARLDAIGRDLDAFWAQLKALKSQQKTPDPAVTEIEAKATLLQAVYLSVSGEGGDERMAGLLADFGQRFPQQTDLLPQAARLRLTGLLQLGKFADAEQVVEQNAEALTKENRADAIEGLAAGYAKAGARRKAEGDAAGGESASRVALGLYQVLDGGGASGDVKRKLAVARLQESTNNWPAAAAIYRDVLQADGNSLLALRGLAGAEAAQGRTAEALALWATYTEKSRPGDPGWFRGQYEQARLMAASGDKRKSCDLLTKLRPSMPGLTDTELRTLFTDLHKQACG